MRVCDSFAFGKGDDEGSRGSLIAIIVTVGAGSSRNRLQLWVGSSGKRICFKRGANTQFWLIFLGSGVYTQYGDRGGKSQGVPYRFLRDKNARFVGYYISPS